VGKIRPLDATRDLEAVVVINNGGHPAVPLVTSADMRDLLGLASLSVGIENDLGELVGFLIAMDPGLTYDSENYLFFESRCDNHFYIDRVVLTEKAQGLGLGSDLYQAVFDKARADGRDRVTCEVNLEPPNPGSLRFHRRWGFSDVGTQPTKGGQVVVQLLEARLD
jgi:predicted GNAT superfamily acetyltransferase